jgi:type I restriction enzyme M protein
LADNWAAIMGDVEIIQTEGMGACNVVEPKTKMVKDKNGVEQEVIDGLKGRIIPFELVQKTLFTDELKAIVALQNRLDAIDGELEAARDELLSMEDAEPYIDSENENALIKNKIKADSKPKAVVEDEIKEQLKAIVALWDEQTALKKKIKSDKETMEKKTITAIQGFNMKDINRFLDLKWIEPITSAIAALPNAIIQSLADAVTSLNEKYVVIYSDIENSIVDSEQELAKLIDQLTGDEYTIAGLSNLFKK